MIWKFITYYCYLLKFFNFSSIYKICFLIWRFSFSIDKYCFFSCFLCISFAFNDSNSDFKFAISAFCSGIFLVYDLSKYFASLLSLSLDLISCSSNSFSRIWMRDIPEKELFRFCRHCIILILDLIYADLCFLFFM